MNGLDGLENVGVWCQRQPIIQDESQSQWKYCVWR